MFDLSQFMSAEDIGVLSGILAVYGVIFGFAGIIGIVCYVFQSIGLFRMAKNIGLNHAWMAWVPVLSTYTLGKIGSKYIKKDGRPSAKFGGWLLALEIAMVILLIGMIVAVVFLVINAIGMESGTNATSETAFFGSLLIFVLVYLVFFAVAIAYSIIYYIALWRTFSIFDNSNATVFLVISIIFSVTLPFFIFAIRNNRPSFTYAERIGFIPPVVSQEPTETENE